MVGIASAATSVLIGYLAANTTTLHLGSGGVMLPNHSPLVIAEQFGTLNTSIPGVSISALAARRAAISRPCALRRHMSGDVDNFPRDVAELVDWFDARDPNPHVRPVPGYGEKIPVWLLGSSLYSAQLAAQLGLPFAFASHFAPDMLFQALHLYRTHFKPSERWRNRTRWCALISLPPTATAMRNSVYLHAAGVRETASRRNRTAAAAGGKYASAVVRFRAVWRQQALSMSLVGDKAKVRHGLESILRETQADEIMVNGQIFDHQARLHSFDLAMQVKEEFGVVKNAAFLPHFQLVIGG
jgi:luciferase family oxidoreductase group 1